MVGSRKIVESRAELSWSLIRLLKCYEKCLNLRLFRIHIQSPTENVWRQDSLATVRHHTKVKQTGSHVATANIVRFISTSPPLGFAYS